MNTLHLIRAIKHIQAAHSQSIPDIENLENEPNESWRDALIAIEDYIETALFNLESFCNSNIIDTEDVFD